MNISKDKYQIPFNTNAIRIYDYKNSPVNVQERAS